MNTTLLPYTQPTATLFPGIMPIRPNRHDPSNYYALINMTTMRVLPMIYNAEKRFGIHSNMITDKGEKKWQKHLKLKKREALLETTDFQKKLVEQAALGCLPHDRRRGRLPMCNIPLDNELLKTTEEKAIGFNAYNKDGLTPLMQAVAIHKNTDYIRYLIYRGADMSKIDKEGNTALMWLIRSLFRLKDDALIKEKWKILDVLLEKNDTLNLKGTAGYTPLMLTVLGGDHKTFFKLLLNGAQANVTNDADETALHLAIKYDTHWMISVVLLYGAADTIMKDNNGHTPFMLATFRKNLEIMEFYIRRGGNIDNTDEQNWTVLMHAVNCGDISLVEYLLSKGACVTYVNGRNETALMIAIHKNDQKIVHILTNAISKYRAGEKLCRLASDGVHISEFANTFYPNLTLRNDTDINKVLENKADYLSMTTSMPKNATEKANNANVTESHYIQNISDVLSHPLRNTEEDSHYRSSGNIYNLNKSMSTDTTSSTSSSLSMFMSPRIKGDIGKIYQSLKRIMSRRAVLNN